MYFYIIDSFIKEKQYAKIYHRMSMRLNDLGIFDDKIQVTKVRPIEDIVRDVLSNRNVKQIIAVGNDHTASNVINAICKYQKDEEAPAFGIIPFNNSDIAHCLGFPADIEESCNMISRRKIEKIDVGKANKDYFLTSLSIFQPNRIAKEQFSLNKIKNLFQKKDNRENIEIELKLENFKLLTRAPQISIINIYNNFWKSQLNQKKISLKKISPYDGLANLLICDNWQKDQALFYDVSFFTTKNITIDAQEKVFALLDNSLKVKVPIEVTIKMKYFNALLGKNRNF